MDTDVAGKATKLSNLTCRHVISTLHFRKMFFGFISVF